MPDPDADPKGVDPREAGERAGDASAPAAGDDERLLDLLERWEERFGRDGGPPPDSFGIEDPALVAALRARIGRRERRDAPAEAPPTGDAGSTPTGSIGGPEADRGPQGGPPTDLPAIGRYRTIRLLGQGGFGRVYLAYDDQLQRRVAIKVPIPGEATRLVDVESYLREARIVARLAHPHIVPVYDVGRLADGRYYLVSQYMEGGDLRERIARGRLGFAEAARMVADLCEALHYTHTQDLFHRDIKPANILLDAGGAPSLADFGLAMRDEDVGRGGGYLGTAAYMSPEQARGEGHRVDGRSDIFSLGVVLYELLAGRRPFRGATHAEILEQVVAVEPRPPRQIDDAIPWELERICLKALAKRASQRYSTARDMAEDLRHFLVASSWADAPTAEVSPIRSGPGGDASRSSSASDSGASPIRIVPRGLGSFDEADADFFLELMPGPRDRGGLPDGLRFWKARIEATDPDRAFRVGLLYGPSGCGKSSMVKAGLLPRLSPHVQAIYLEAAGEETEARLMRGLRRPFPALPEGGGLADAMIALRHGRGLPEGRKVLLVLDQFEQWLFARRGESAGELVAALRQCDGERVQALCLVRDDFWMAATRFMRELDVDLVPDRNVAAVDLFEPRHARKVLAAYGRAYDALPTQSRDLTRDQAAFLDQAVAGLAQDGLIVPVRLALFAEMVKGRPWTPATLREVGGMEGVGVKFLEDTFSSPRASPNHRYHQRAAQAVLKALLPEANADIKGRMRSADELREASGYADRPADLADLLRLLDGELRLITPVDPEGSVDAEAPAHATGGRYYQLTHDYLVHALRDWLTRKQRETRRGRAELLLAERAAVWASRPEDRYLPTPREWASLRLLTRRRDWSEPQRRMMARAGRRAGLRAGGAAVLAAALGIAGWIAWRRVDESNHRTRAEGLVQQLLRAEIARVPESVAAIRDYRRWTDPELTRLLGQSADDPERRLRLGLALLPVDGRFVDDLFDRMLKARPDEPATLAVIGRALWPHRDTLIPRSWAALDGARPGDPRVLTSAAALALFAPDDPRWSSAGEKVARALVGAPRVFVGAWVDALHPVGGRLKAPLAAIYRDRGRPDGERTVAAEILALYASDDAELLADLAMEASPRDFVETLFPAASRHAGAAVAAWRAELDRGAAPDAQDPPPADEAADARRARAAIALIRMGRAEHAWPHLRHGPRPQVRSFIVNGLRPMGAGAAAVADGLDRPGAIARPADAGRPRSGRAMLFDPVASERRAIVLALGTFEPSAFAADERERLVARLFELYRDDPDAGVHGAAGWALRRWGLSDRIAAVERELRGVEIGRRQWYVNGHGQTLVVVDGPVEFAMGSPAEEPGTRPHELVHRRAIRRRFAIGTREVTVDEYREFLRDRPNERLRAIDPHSPEPDGPRNDLTWYDAVAYCNWLSRREGLTEVYEPNEKGEFAAGMRIRPDAARLDGYRLPTEAEWEYACRAGTVTAWFFGDSPAILGNYAWTIANSGDLAHPCGSLLPNDLGMFDVVGNVYEWCQGGAVDYPSDATVAADPLNEGEVIPKAAPRVIRGGSFTDRPLDSRSAHRDRDAPESPYMTYGFRIARTIP